MKHFKSSDTGGNAPTPREGLPVTLHLAEDIDNKEDLAPSELRARDLMRARYQRVLNREEND